MQNKMIMVLSGSLWQIPIVKRIREMGFKSLVVNLHENSPAFEFADRHEVADLLDLEACASIAKKYDVAAVVSEQCDIAMPALAYVAKTLGLPALSRGSADLFTNKLLMRLFCQKHGFPYPEYVRCRTSEEVIKFFNKRKREIILKPIDANSSRGVHSIQQLAQVEPAFEDAFSYSKRERAVIAEDYVQGPEFTVDGIVAGGRHHSLAVSKKCHYAHNKNIAYQLFFSYDDESFDYDRLKQVNDRFIDASGLEEGTLTHSEYKFEDGEFYLIETAARGGGNLVASHIVPLMSGFDNYRYYINKALGFSHVDYPASLDPLLKERCAVLHFFSTSIKSGIVKGLRGKEFLESSPEVIAFRLNFSIGDTIREAGNDAARIGFYIAYAEGREELIVLQKRIQEEFFIEMEAI